MCIGICAYLDDAIPASTMYNIGGSSRTYWCSCNDGFYYDTTNKVCKPYNSCSNIPNVDTTVVNQNINNCKCKSGYYWERYINYCLVDKCVSNPSLCSCSAPKPIWNATLSACLPDCTKDKNSTGLFIPNFLAC